MEGGDDVDEHQRKAAMMSGLLQRFNGSSADGGR